MRLLREGSYVEMEPIPELTQEQRLEMIEQAIQRVEMTLDRVEREIDVAVNYARASAQAAGLIARAKEDYAKLDDIWKHLLAERKDATGK